MMTRIHGKINFECDDCGEVLALDTSDFGEAQRDIKNEGWATRKIGNDWAHFCAECVSAGTHES